MLLPAVSWKPDQGRKRMRRKQICRLARQEAGIRWVMLTLLEQHKLHSSPDPQFIMYSSIAQQYRILYSLFGIVPVLFRQYVVETS